MGTRVNGEQQPTDRSPSGLPLRHLVTGALGSTDIYVGEQWLQPGERVLLHSHVVEEVLVFTAGEGEASVGTETFPVECGVTIHIPASEIHGFRNTGQDELRLYVIFPGNQFPATNIIES